MKLELFRARLELASERAREFAGQWIEERLPEPLRFRVRLNQSYDGNPLHVDERVFPADSDSELAPALADCSLDEVVATLWRDGLVPEWINVSVIGEREHWTLVELLCCGRFTANDELLYHRESGRPPFTFSVRRCPSTSSKVGSSASTIAPSAGREPSSTM